MAELLTVHEVAEFCRVHEVTVRRQIASGQLASVRVGKGVRVRKEDLDAFLGAPSVPGSSSDQGGAPVLRADDPIFGLIGAFSDEPWVASDKYRALLDVRQGRP